MAAVGRVVPGVAGYAQPVQFISTRDMEIMLQNAGTVFESVRRSVGC